MHIPDAILSPPVALTTGALAVAGIGYSLRRLERELGERTTVLMGITAAFVFAAQMVNFPVGPGVSGHLLGGVLAAVLLGPWGGAGVIAAVLLVQCFAFGDGGLTALGANFVNMGLLGSVGGYAIYAPLRRAIGGRRGVLIGAMIAAWFSVILAAGAFAVELAASGRLRDFPRILAWMTLVHAAIGVGEAVITGLILRYVLLIRPDFIHDAGATEAAPLRRVSQTVIAGLGVALAVAVFLGPLAYDAPDGLEFVGQKLGFGGDEARPVLPAPISDYTMPGIEAASVATALAGLVGTLLVFGLSLLLARTLGRRNAPSVEAAPAHVP